MNDIKNKGLASNNIPSFLSTKAAAVYLGFTSSALIKWRGKGKGPHYFKICHSIRYNVDDLNAWLEERRRLTEKRKR